MNDRECCAVKHCQAPAASFSAANMTATHNPENIRCQALHTTLNSCYQHRLSMHHRLMMVVISITARGACIGSDVSQISKQCRSPASSAAYCCRTCTRQLLHCIPQTRHVQFLRPEDATPYFARPAQHAHTIRQQSSCWYTSMLMHQQLHCSHCALTGQLSWQQAMPPGACPHNHMTATTPHRNR